MRGEPSSIIKTPILGKRLTWRPHIPVKLGFEARRARARFERKVEQKIYRFETVRCFCGEESGMLLSTVERHGLHYPLMVCQNCGLVRSNPRLTPENFSMFYDSEYRSLYGDDDADLNDRFERWVLQGREVFRYISTNRGAIHGVVLDVGCNTGAQLVPFREAGCEVYGVDFGSRYLEYGRKKTGISTLLQGGVEKFLALGKKADLVIMSHVFEHMLDLEGELRKVRAAMADNAALYISVPGTYWWINHMCGGNILYLLQNAHTYQFSLTSLTYVLECCGFRRISGDEKITAIFEVTRTHRPKTEIPTGEAKKVIEFMKRIEKRYSPKWMIGQCLGVFGLKEYVNRGQGMLREFFRTRAVPRNFHL